MRLGLTLVMLAAAAMAPALALENAPTLSSIRVTGDSKVTAKPDRVQIDLGVTTRATHSQEAASQNARQLDAVLAAVKRSAGPTATFKTIGYALNPNYQYHVSGGEPSITGYTASNTVQVTLDDLARIGSVIDSATQAGANHVQGIRFTLRDQDAVRAAALREAALRARAEADVLAAALGLRVVRILSVEESSPRMLPVLNMPMPRVAMSSAAEVSTPVEAGTLEVTADLTLTVEVAPLAR